MHADPSVLSGMALLSLKVVQLFRAYQNPSHAPHNEGIAHCVYTPVTREVPISPAVHPMGYLSLWMILLVEHLCVTLIDS